VDRATTDRAFRDRGHSESRLDALSERLWCLGSDESLSYPDQEVGLLAHVSVTARAAVEVLLVALALRLRELAV